MVSSNDDDSGLIRIQPVELFRVGEWNGDDYSEEDLQEMVSAFSKVGYRVPITLGHVKGTGQPAHGWVESIWVHNDTLMGCLLVVPELHQAIQQRKFGHVSVEIYWDLKRDNQSFPRALKAVAILGAETPAVSDLRPLFDSLSQATCGRVATYVIQNGDKPMERTDVQLDRRIRDLMNSDPNLNYEQAAQRLFANDAQARQLYKQQVDADIGIEQRQQQRPASLDFDAPRSDAAAKKLHSAAMELIRDGKAKNYADAAAMAINADPVASRDYLQVH